MAIEVFANAAQTTLNGAVLAGDGTITVSSATAFPATGNFRILIDNEYILVTGVSGSVFTVTRAQEGSGAAGHSNGATVTHVLTKGSMNQFRADSTSENTWANLPAAGAAGRLFVQNDGNYFALDNGASWDSYGPVYPLTPPISTGYSWVNQGLATITTTKGGFYLSAASSGTTNVRMRKKTISAPPYSYIIGFLPLVPSVDTFKCGLCLYDSVGGGVVGLSIAGAQVSNTSPESWYRLEKYTNTTTFSAAYNFLHGNGGLGNSGIGGSIIWMKVSDDNSQRHWYVSADGQNYIEIANQSRTDFITPDSIGFFLDTGAGSMAVGMTILSIVG